jgi:hypothetical protein
MNKSIGRIAFLLVLVFAMPSGDADELQLPFAETFDSAMVRTVYGEADHAISASWTADTISVSTDLYGGRTVSDFNSTNRLYLLQVLEDVHREQAVPLNDSCQRTWVEVTFYRGKDSVTRRACLFPVQHGLAKKILDFIEFATLTM